MSENDGAISNVSAALPINALDDTRAGLGQQYNGDATCVSTGSDSVPITVRHHNNSFQVNVPRDCTLKELFLSLSRQLETVEPNAAFCLETQGNATDGW